MLTWDDFSFNNGLLPYLTDPIAKVFDDWYKSGWNERKYKQLNFLKQIPFVSWNVNTYEANNENNDYMRENQITWNDVKRPSKLPGSGSISGIYGGIVNYTSSNIRRLYR